MYNIQKRSLEYAATLVVVIVVLVKVLWDGVAFTACYSLLCLLYLRVPASFLMTALVLTLQPQPAIFHVF